MLSNSRYMTIFSSENFSLKQLVFCCCFFLCFNLVAQPLDWVSVNTNTTSSYDSDIQIATDGSLYAIGVFADTIDLEPGSGISNFVSSGGNDMYIQKLNFQGGLIWGKQIGNNQNIYTEKIRIDANGDLIIIGRFIGTVDFDPNAGVQNLTGDEQDFYGFILKLNASGDFIWVKEISGSQDIEPSSLYTDNDNAIYTIGAFKGTADFDPDPVDVLNLSSTGPGDHMFIQKLDEEGDLDWVKSIGGNGNTRPSDIVLDSSGNIYITGDFNQTVDFNPEIGINNFIPIVPNTYTTFVLKLDSLGQFTWTKILESAGVNGGNTIKVDDDNIYIGGHFRADMDFDPGTGVSSLSSFSVKNGYVLKLNLQGHFIWAAGFESLGSAKCEVKDLGIDDNGNIYVLGDFTGDVDFNPNAIDAEAFFYSSFGSYDIFIEKLSPNGEYIWMKQMGGPTTDKTYAIQIDPSNNIFTTGIFSNTLDFDLGSGVLNHTANGIYDTYIHKMSQCEFEENISPVACLRYESPSGHEVWRESGVYSDVVADTNFEGCYIVYSIDLTVKHVNTGIQRVGDTFIADADNAIYQWYHCEFNLLAMPGATNQSFNVPQNDPYLVIVTENGCTDTSDCVWVDNLALLDLNQDNQPIVYYNAEVNFIGLEHDLGLEGIISLRDLYGRILQSYTLRNQQNQFLMDVSAYPKGIYLIDYLKKGGSSLVKKIIIQ